MIQTIHRSATWGAILCAVLFVMKSNAAEKVSDPLVIEWTNFAGDKWSYHLRGITDEAIQVELQTNGRSFVVQTNHFKGGMSELLKLAQATVGEISTNQPRITVGKTKCKLSVKVAEEASERQASIEGDLKPLLDYFHSNPNVRKLLGFVSEDLPKKYRLVDEPGPLKQIISPP